MNPLDRLKVLINSSTPIVVMETVEEVQAVSLVRSACSELNLAELSCGRQVNNDRNHVELPGITTVI